MKSKTLRQLKTDATKREQARVYENMDLPPRDIVVEHEGHRHIKRAWQSPGRFGWEKWEQEY